MKVSKSGVIAAALALLLLIVAFGWVNRRAVAQAERRVAAQLAEKIAKEERAKFDEERAKHNEERNAWIEQASTAGEAYSRQTQEAERQRRRADTATRANASLDAAWDAKYKNEKKAHEGTVAAWRASDEEKDRLHGEEVGKLKGALKLAEDDIAGLELKIRGKWSEDGKTLLEPGYIQQLAAAEAANAVLKRRGRGWLAHGPGLFAFWRNGRIDGAPGYGVIIRVGGK